MRKFILQVFALVLITGCQNGSQNAPSTFEMADVPPVARMEAADAPEVEDKTDQGVSLPADQLQNKIPEPASGKRIIRDGNLTLRVMDLSAARSRVDSMIKAMGGYIGNESYNSYEQESTYSLTIRVPAQHFDNLVGLLETGQGDVIFKDISARDVTEEFIDLETRLASKHKFIDRYTELLKSAGSVKDMLEIEENIRKIEEEIESTEGRLRYLNDQVSYSRLNLTLAQEKEFKYRPQHARNFIERLKESVHKGWKGFVGFILLMVKIWPFWMLALAVWIIYRKIKAKKRIKTGFKT
jgi:hypothetical protein